MTKQKRTHKTAKVLLSLAVAGALVGSVFAGCSAGKSDKGNKNATAGVTGSITVVSREEGSGTRGAFIELLPGKDGLLHISKLSNERVDKVEDVLNVGDEVEVKVQEIDSQGRVNLIRNDIVYERKAFSPRPQGDSSSSHAGGRPPRRDGRN